MSIKMNGYNKGNETIKDKVERIAREVGWSVYVDDETENVIMGIRKLDDLPDDLKKIAVEIIRMELDKSFKG